MISLYYGKIGDGKTYHVMYNELLPAVRDGRQVYTNIDGLNKKHIRMLTGQEPKIEHIASQNEFKERMGVSAEDKEGLTLKFEKNALIIIDEAQLIWDARDFKNTSKNFLTLLEYHRHYGLDLVFITQNPKRLEGAVTRLSNNSYQIKNLSFLFGPFKNRYVIHIRQTPFDRDIVATMSGKLHKEVFACYQSAVVAIAGKSSVRRKTALQGGLFYFIGALMIFLTFMFIQRGGFHLLTPFKSSNMQSKAVTHASSILHTKSASVISALSVTPVSVAVSVVKIKDGIKNNVRSASVKGIVVPVVASDGVVSSVKCIPLGYYISDDVRHDVVDCGGRVVERIVGDGSSF